MITLAFFLFGALFGGMVYYYLTHFIDNLIQAISESYWEIFPQTPPHFSRGKSAFLPIKCGHLGWYFLIFGLMFVILSSMFEVTKALWLGCIFTLGYIIIRIDWHYQLISPSLCQQLFVLGLVGAYWQFNSLSLIQSLQGAAVGFVSFYGIYWFARWGYGKEALGRGDYWLMLGLGSLSAWQQIPLLIFSACSIALVYAAYLKCRGQQVTLLPFAPFLWLGWGIVFFY